MALLSLIIEQSTVPCLTTMFNYHSLIPWGSFRGQQEAKWGSFRGRDHFGVNLGIISGLEIISGSGSFRGLYKPQKNWKETQRLYLFSTYSDEYMIAASIQKYVYNSLFSLEFCAIIVTAISNMSCFLP